jgi:hypothetical protein
MTIRKFFLLLVLLSLLFGCSTYPHRVLLKTIKPGITRARLADKLGDPEKTKAIGRHYWVKYYLANDAAVCTAHYFIFDSQSRLVKWEEDKKDKIVDKNDVLIHMLTPY